MGYGTSLYMLDVGKLQAIFGSKDMTLLDQLKQRYADRFTGNASYFATEITAGAPSLDQALGEIIAGSIPPEKVGVADRLKATLFGKFHKPRFGFQYGYALEVLCLSMGRMVADGDSLGMIAELDIDTLLSEDRQPIPIPAAADFPSISYVTHQEIEQEWEQVSTAEALSEDDEFADDRKKLLTCLDEARKQKLGLVGFYY